MNAEPLSTESDPADAALQEIMDSSGGLEASADADDAAAGLAAVDASSVAEQTQDAAITMPADAKIAESPVEIVPIDPGGDQTTAESTASDAAPAPAADDDSMLELPTDPQPAPPRKKPSMSDESAEAIAAADRAVDALLSFDGSAKQRRGQLAKTYAKIAAACYEANGPSDALRGLTEKIANSPLVQQFEDEDIGSQWLEYKARSSNGIALIGQPGTSDDGQTLTLDSGKVVPLTGGQPLPSAEKVLAMGRIVDQGASVELVLAEPLP